MRNMLKENHVVKMIAKKERKPQVLFLDEGGFIK